ncbi:MAG: Holliday junction branch migration protein RuvA [Candidatus Omnitrophota bacterium]
MFAYLKGKLAIKTPALVVIDVGGVGYEVRIPISTFDQLPDEGKESFLYIYPCYRPESITLCGFATQAEKNLFNLLLGVSGVGPKVALTILSGTTIAGFCRAIIAEDNKTLSAISGVGKKLSQRLITELKDQVQTLGGMPMPAGEAVLEKDAIGALVTLGYPRVHALKAVQQVLTSRKAAAPNLETLIKEALKII